MRIWPRFIFVLTGLCAVLAASSSGAGAAAQEDWVIRSFNATYEIDESGTFSVTEDIAVDFGSVERHGIFRDIPVEYHSNGESTRLDFASLITITDVSVTDGSVPVPFETNDLGPNLRIRIGDPEVLVSGRQRYLISYMVGNGLNRFNGREELYWNITGQEWEVTIDQASATVTAPDPTIERIACFQGPTGSTDPCASSFDETTASFQTTAAQPPGSGLTIVVSLTQGVAPVEPSEDTEDGARRNGSQSGGGVGAVLLLGIVAGVALAGGLIAVVTMVFIRRRFLRY